MDYGAMYLTAKKTNIKSVSKQSKFEGSDREVRGWIVKQLVQKGTITLQEISTEFPHKAGEKIVEGLITEGVITKKRNLITIAEK
jgi:A/G-specific adenine glycosylase